MMLVNSLKGLLVGAGLALGTVPMAALAEYPEREVELVIPFGPGGATDVLFRLISAEAEKHLGAAIVPVNMAGAGATRGSRAVKDAEPNGYTILGSHDTVALSKLAGMVDYSYEAFEPVILLTQTTNILSVAQGSSFTSISEIVEHANANPGELTFSMTPSSTDHFFWVAFLEAAGIPAENVRLIGYKDTGEQVSALIAGDIDFGLFNLPSAGGQYSSGTLRPIAVGSEERLSALPDTPTMREQGVDLVAATNRGVFAPKGTAPEVIEALADAYEAALGNENIVSRIENEFGSTVSARRGAAYAEFLAANEAELTKAAESIDFSR